MLKKTLVTFIDSHKNNKSYSSESIEECKKGIDMMFENVIIK